MNLQRGAATVAGKAALIVVISCDQAPSCDDETNFYPVACRDGGRVERLAHAEGFLMGNQSMAVARDAVYFSSLSAQLTRVNKDGTGERVIIDRSHCSVEGIDVSTRSGEEVVWLLESCPRWGDRIETFREATYADYDLLLHSYDPGDETLEEVMLVPNVRAGGLRASDRGIVLQVRDLGGDSMWLFDPTTAETRVVTAVEANDFDFDVHGDYAYFVSVDAAGTHGLSSIDLSDERATPVFVTELGQWHHLQVTDDGRIFWSVDSGEQSGTDGRLHYLHTWTDDRSEQLTPVGTAVHFVVQGSDVFYITLRHGDTYLERVTLPDGDPEILVRHADRGWEMYADEDNVYWIQTFDDGVMKASQ